MGIRARGWQKLWGWKMRSLASFDWWLLESIEIWNLALTQVWHRRLFNFSPWICARRVGSRNIQPTASPQHTGRRGKLHLSSVLLILYFHTWLNFIHHVLHWNLKTLVAKTHWKNEHRQRRSVSVMCHNLVSQNCVERNINIFLAILAFLYISLSHSPKIQPIPTSLPDPFFEGS